MNKKDPNQEAQRDPETDVSPPRASRHRCPLCQSDKVETSRLLTGLTHHTEDGRTNWLIVKRQLPVESTLTQLKRHCKDHIDTVGLDFQ